MFWMPENPVPCPRLMTNSLNCDLRLAYLTSALARGNTAASFTELQNSRAQCSDVDGSGQYRRSAGRHGVT